MVADCVKATGVEEKASFAMFLDNAPFTKVTTLPAVCKKLDPFKWACMHVACERLGCTLSDLHEGLRASIYSCRQYVKQLHLSSERDLTQRKLIDTVDDVFHL